MSAKETAEAARHAYEESQALEAKDRLYALSALKGALLLARDDILAANAQDVDAAKFQVAGGHMDASLLKRLDLQSNAGKFDDMISGLDAVAALGDPNEQVLAATRLDDGLDLYKVACPIGVLLVIFEARPEVMVNITALALKSGASACLYGVLHQPFERQCRDTKGRQGIPQDPSRPSEGHPCCP
jgi:glutamate-5-semialdehyde dehydrogenase